MKTRTTVIPLLAIAVMIPALVFSFNITDDKLQTNEKLITSVTFDENEMNLSTLTQGSELVIEGKILTSNVFTKKVHDGQVFPDIYTKHQIQIIEVLKGETNKKVISVVTHGGELDDRVSKTHAIPIKDRDTVILFLEENGAHYTGAGAYNPIAPIQGVFLIEDSKAKSSIFSEMNVSDMRNAVSLAQQS